MTGIYCIEATWDGPFSVQKPLSFVAEAHATGKPVHRVARTPEEFETALSRWAKRTDWEYPIVPTRPTAAEALTLKRRGYVETVC